MSSSRISFSAERRNFITVVNPILMWFFWGFFLWLPAWFVIFEWFAVNLWSALQPSSGAGGVAFVAHIGGFVAGLVLVPLLRAREAVLYDAWTKFLGPRLRGGTAMADTEDGQLAAPSSPELERPMRIPRPS